MSYIVDFTEISSFTPNVINGFDIVGLDASENVTQNIVEDRAIASGSITDLIERSSGFDFIDSEAIEDEIAENALGTENEAIVDKIESELVEGNIEGNLLSEIAEQNGFELEFFSNGETKIVDGDFDLTNGEPIVRGSIDNAEVKYDRESGSLSIDGQELAKIDISLDFNDDNYDIF